jgi:hypothetical protein
VHRGAVATLKSVLVRVTEACSETRYSVGLQGFNSKRE